MDLHAQIAQLKAENAALKKVVAEKVDGPLGLLQTIGDTLAAKQNDSNQWHGSTLESINDLKPDYAGKVGELFLQQLCATGSVQCLYAEDVNSKDGTYDAIVNGKKVEIKTARLGVQRAFQHETLKKDGYDYLLFIDIKPNQFYMTVLARFDMTAKHPLIGRKPHPRKGTSDVFKFDFSDTSIQNGMAAGVSMKVDATTSMEEVIAFITETCI